jgi:hypothetical protein
MTVAAVTKAFGTSIQHLMPVWIKFYKAAATDMIDTTQLTPPYKGIMPLNGFSFSATACTALPAMQFGMGRIESGADTYTATTTSIYVDTIVEYVAAYPRVPPYYILAQDAGTTAFEIMEVTADSLPEAAASTLTVKRGCLGTTACAACVADEAYVFFMNILYLTDATIGTCLVYALPLPSDPKASLFKAVAR